MALNPFYNLLSLSLITGGIISIVLWYYQFKVDKNIFSWGILTWIASYLAMSISDFFVRSLIYLPNAVLPFYLGASAAIFNILIPFYVLTKKSDIFKKFQDKVAFGLGYAGIELIMVGILNMMIFNILLSNPDLLVDLPQGALAIFSFNTLYYVFWSFVTLLQAFSVAFLHVFTTLVLFAYVYSKKEKWLFIAIVFEVLINTMANYFINYAEMLYIASAIIVFAIFWRYREEIDRAKPIPLKRKKNPKKK